MPESVVDEFDEHVEAAQASLSDARNYAASFSAPLRDRMVAVARVEGQEDSEATPADLIDTLVDHRQAGSAPQCTCGWKAPVWMNDTGSDRLQWAEHVAA